MNTLIVKLNATGDVVRTTPVLRRLGGEVPWVTAERNAVLIEGIARDLRCVGWENRELARDREYDLVISLEDEAEVAEYVAGVRHQRLFGACLGKDGRVLYTPDSSAWFDLSLISSYGKQRADELKYQNRRSYQELIFEGLGWQFTDEAYILPKPAPTTLHGDVAIAPVAGPVWPMKNWAYYEEVQKGLESEGLRVNILPQRSSLREHLGDIANHHCVLCGDSLPMHFAIGLGRRCVAIFNCTSPWEIHDYGLLTKLVSPLLGEFFYKRGMNERAITAIRPGEVLRAVSASLADAGERSRGVG